MSSQETLESLLDDLRKIRDVCSYENMEEQVPSVAVDYLLANRALIESYLRQIYDEMDEPQRIELSNQNQDLHYSAAYDHFREDAEHAIEVAHLVKGEWVEMNGEDIKKLLRALKYARYAPDEAQRHTLRMSPVEQYGLNMYVGYEDSLTPEEKQAIRWDISDIFYFGEKRKIIQDWRSCGLDLDNHKLRLVGSFRTLIEGCRRSTVDLLRLRLELDSSVVCVGAPNSTHKYTNLLIRRMRSEFEEILGDLRESFTEFFMSGANVYRTVANVEDLLEPFKDEFEALRFGISEVRPSPATYALVHRLVAGQIEGRQIKIAIGELNMGDKYTVGQAGAVGPHSHAHDINFNQVWNQTSDHIDLSTLARELADLRQALKIEASEAEHDAVIGTIASAEIEAKRHDGPKALEYLSKASQWALDIASKIGVTVASSAIKKSLGIE